MIDMSLWEERMTDEIIDTNRVNISVNEYAKEVSKDLGLEPVKFEIESRPCITMERTKNNRLIPWKRHKTLRGKYLCSMWWNDFDGGQAYLNADGSVSYVESETDWDKGGTVTKIDAYLSYNEDNNTFGISEKPDYETAEHLPFRSPEAYDAWVKKHG